MLNEKILFKNLVKRAQNKCIYYAERENFMQKCVKKTTDLAELTLIDS